MRNSFKPSCLRARQCCSCVSWLRLLAFVAIVTIPLFLNYFATVFGLPMSRSRQRGRNVKQSLPEPCIQDLAAPQHWNYCDAARSSIFISTIWALQELNRTTKETTNAALAHPHDPGVPGLSAQCQRTVPAQ